tara:strand:+ start:411 stop:608 length:198 start_codon:yes stop_codon:yes gene_type:complete
MTQLEQVKLHLEEYNTITSWEAIQKYHITRLAAVIHTLRNEHKMQINSDWGTNDGKKWVEYKLVN